MRTTRSSVTSQAACRARTSAGATLLLAALVIGCGGGASGGQQAKTPKRPPPSVVVLNGGSLVNIGGGRSLYLKCVGSGSPTVVLESGFGGTTNDWSAVQPQLARTMRTCAYDRAGLGNSLPMPGVHDAGDEAEDLRRLLEGARVPPPYRARRTLLRRAARARLRRRQSRRHGRRRARRRDGPQPGSAPARRSGARHRRGSDNNLPRPTADPVVDHVDVRASEALDAKVLTLHRLPLAVITRGLAQEDEFPPTGATRGGRGVDEDAGQLAALSPDRLHVVATRSGHFVQSYAEAARRRHPRRARGRRCRPAPAPGFPPARASSGGPGVRCRG